MIDRPHVFHSLDVLFTSPYRVDEYEVFISPAVGAALRWPSSQEAYQLDQYFKTPEARDAHGQILPLCGATVKRVDGRVFTVVLFEAPVERA